MTLEEFIFRRVQTVEQLRAILLLHAEPDRVWNDTDLAGRLYLEPRRAAEVADALVKTGMATRDTNGLIFHSQTGENATLLEQVVTMDRERPVSLIRMIYSKPNTLEAFSEAFRLRRNQ